MLSVGMTEKHCVGRWKTACKLVFCQDDGEFNDRANSQKPGGGAGARTDARRLTLQLPGLDLSSA